MFLTIYDPLGGEETQAVDSAGLTLEQLLPEDPCSIVVNGHDGDWRSYIAQQGDRVEVKFKAGLTFGLVGIWAVIAQAVSAVVINAAISGIVMALTPKPKKPKLDSNRKEAFGIAGFQNTTGPGTPKFTPYGLNSVRGHVISSGVRLSGDGKQMHGRVLYFMGWTGGDGVGGWGEITLNGTEISQFPEIVVHTRDGVSGQSVIPEFENVENTFQPSSGALDFDPETQIGTPVIYTTQGDQVQRATLFIYFPGGLYRINARGNHRGAGVTYTVEIRPNSGGAWTPWAMPGFWDQEESGRFYVIELADFPAADKWDIRITVTAWQGWVQGEVFAGTSILYNVQETEFTTLNYPEWALLGLTNIPSKKVQSFATMDVAVIMSGKRVKIPDGQGNTTLAFTRQRCWIVRDMMTHPIVGMGDQIDESEIDDDQWLTDSQAYYDEQVQGHDGLETRDYCDFILSAIDWDWDWIKKVAGEGRGRIIPSGGKWKYVIDKPGVPNIAYVEGGNIIENSVNLEIGPFDEHQFNQISGEFRNAEKDYTEDFSPMLIDSGIGSDPPIPEYVKYETITRESEVQRENMILLKRNILERRRWTFNCPIGAIVSEPMDIDYFGERGIGNEGAVGGVLPIGSTVNQIVLPNVMNLEAGETYAAIVKHRRTNVTEYRTVSTAAGITGTIAVTSPFTALPEEEDIFSVGIEDVDHIPTRCQEIQIDRDGRVKQIRTEYVAAVYTQDALPPKSARRFFGPGHNYPPIPIRYAAIAEEAAVNRDGSIRSILLFTVTPGLSRNAGKAQGGLTDRIILANEEPGLHDYFIGAFITFNGEKRLCQSYDGITRTAMFSVPFSAAPQSGDDYLIEWEKFGDFMGFRIEQSENGGVDYVTIGTTNAAHWESDSRGLGPGDVYFRLTPFSIAGIENAVARHVIPVTLQGDLSAPAKPVSVEIASHLLTVSVTVKLQKPVAEDFASVEIEIWRTALDTGVLLEVARFGASADTGSTGFLTVIGSFNLGARPVPEQYGAVIWARARAKDHSDNPLEGTAEWTNLAVDSTSGTTLVGDPAASQGPDYGPPAVPTGLTIQSSLIQDIVGVWRIQLTIFWDPNTEPDMSRYEVQYRVYAAAPPPNPPTVRIVEHPQVSIREVGVLGNTTYEARVQAIDLDNLQSGFTSWIPHTTTKDTTPPAPPTGVIATGGFGRITVFFQPPADSDFDHVVVYMSTTNDVTTALGGVSGSSAPGSNSLVITKWLYLELAHDTTYYLWLVAVDHSGNFSNYHTGTTNGTPATTLRIGPGDIVTTNLITQTAQIANAVIDDAKILSLSADKINGGTLRVAFSIGVGGGTGRVFIDGPSRAFWVVDDNNQVRVVAGYLGGGATSYGMYVLDQNGSVQWGFDGANTIGIAPMAVTEAYETVNDGWINLTPVAAGQFQICALGIISTGSIVQIEARVLLGPLLANQPITGGDNGFDVKILRGATVGTFGQILNEGTVVDTVTEYGMNGVNYRFSTPRRITDRPPGSLSAPQYHVYSLTINGNTSTGFTMQVSRMRMSALVTKDQR